MSCTRPQLVAELSRVDGRREVTLETISKRLCASGLMASNGPYCAPAHMGWPDAVNLLIGSNAALTAAEAPEVVARFRAFRPRLITSAGSEDRLPSEISDAETFGAALEALIATVPVIEESFLDLIQRKYPTALPSVHSRLAFGPMAVIGIEVECTRGAVDTGVIRLVSCFERPKVDLEIAFDAEADSSAALGGDRLVTSRVGFPTLRALYAAVSDRSIGAAAAPAFSLGEGTSGDVPGGAPRRESVQ